MNSDSLGQRRDMSESDVPIGISQVLALRISEALFAGQSPNGDLIPEEGADGAKP